ncbi:hypothetical protein UFOVP1344_9 [uncultured Caudovirales phage]|uniref:Uncharacterized protein n=1 Tax=uncultured Caudovirales phage TaxID=2100421 RepID=A0A6J5ST74_9CAUD|nr:hypothetical protein UFOVP1005_9 [uncultured Caudovirales phage]CAB4199731.1 hypothetical protein UFOVP1344_9 [uncultured Caudovirales phage]CAB4218460.1 hypothetical protein UFOVP1602_31 [uncultured Caudovirales phage]
MTESNIRSIIDAVTEVRSDVNDVRRELLDRLDQIDARLRHVEIEQAKSNIRTLELSNKWKAGIATGIASGIAALLQALIGAQK